MHKYNTGANLITIIKSLYEKATSAVLFNGNTGDWFQTTVGVRQGCLLSPTLFNVFLVKIMTALENHEGTARIGGRIITKLTFCQRHRRTGLQGRTGKPRQISGDSINSVWHGDQPRENKDHVKQS